MTVKQRKALLARIPIASGTPVYVKSKDERYDGWIGIVTSYDSTKVSPYTVTQHDSTVSYYTRSQLQVATVNQFISQPKRISESNTVTTDKVILSYVVMLLDGINKLFHRFGFLRHYRKGKSWRSR